MAMKKISNRVNRSASGGPRKSRDKIDKVKNLNITSLVDILTILLVFLIKNISVDTLRLTVPENMDLPSTVYTEDLESSGQAVVIKLYTDQILVGAENIRVGSLDSFLNDAKVRREMLSFMNEQTHLITSQEGDLKPLLLIQADTRIQCRYITDVVALGATAGFTSIYFSSVKGEDPIATYGIGDKGA